MLDTVWQRLLSCGAEEEADMEKSDVCEEENAEEEKQVEEEVEPTQVKKLLCKLRWFNNIILSFRT